MRGWGPQFIGREEEKVRVRIDPRWRVRIPCEPTQGPRGGVETKSYALKAFLVSTLLKVHWEYFPMCLGKSKGWDIS